MPRPRTPYGDGRRYAYSLKGSPQPGWVNIQFKNGGVENHMMAVVALKKGVTAAQLKKAAIAQDDAAFAKIAQGDGDVPGTPELLGPGQETATITQLKAGHYGIMCFVPAPDGSPHVAHGMVKTFDVTGSKSSYKPPQDGVADVTISDTAITVPAGAAPQHATIKVTNSGKEPHSFTLVKLEAGQDHRRREHVLQRVLQHRHCDGHPAGNGRRRCRGGRARRDRVPRLEPEAGPLRVPEHQRRRRRTTTSRRA